MLSWKDQGYKVIIDFDVSQWSVVVPYHIMNSDSPTPISSPWDPNSRVQVFTGFLHGVTGYGHSVFFSGTSPSNAKIAGQVNRDRPHLEYGVVYFTYDIKAHPLREEVITGRVLHNVAEIQLFMIPQENVA